MFNVVRPNGNKGKVLSLFQTLGALWTNILEILPKDTESLPNIFNLVLKPVKRILNGFMLMISVLLKSFAYRLKFARICTLFARPERKFAHGENPCVHVVCIAGRN